MDGMWQMAAAGWVCGKEGGFCIWDYGLDVVCGVLREDREMVE